MPDWPTSKMPAYFPHRLANQKTVNVNGDEIVIADHILVIGEQWRGTRMELLTKLNWAKVCWVSGQLDTKHICVIKKTDWTEDLFMKGPSWVGK